VWRTLLLYLCSLRQLNRSSSHGTHPLQCPHEGQPTGLLRDLSREHPDANLQQLAADRSDRPVIAVFGQVPRDSNILAWSRIDSAGLVAVVRDAAMAAGFQVVVRRYPSVPDHPLPEGTLAAPAAMSPRALVAAAEFAATINSSTALEGLLQARPSTSSSTDPSRAWGPPAKDRAMPLV
jgi:hypothetical protein